MKDSGSPGTTTTSWGTTRRDGSAVGSLLVDSVFQRDIPAVQGCILVITLFFLVINTAVDIAYKLIDPRIRYT